MSASSRLLLLRHLLPAGALLAAGAIAASSSQTGAAPDAIIRPASPSARAGSAWLMGAAQAGARLVAVGERGIVLLSDDTGKTWRQAAESPTSVTLTAVRFTSASHGWATGHAGSILATQDGGEHWRRQLDGSEFARKSLARAQAALAAGDDKGKAGKAVGDAERLVADGSDKPFFDLYFSDPQHGLAVGAYNLVARTDDGGKTWVPAPELLPNPKGSHLYAVQGRGETVFVAGEQGLLLRSTDGGRSFKALASPYAGSFFTLALLPGGELIAAGLRGNAFRSIDQGETWQPLAGLPPVSWVASAVSADGTAWLGNQAGQVFVSRDAGQRWQPLPPQPGRPSMPLTGLLSVAPGQLLTTSVRGVGQLSVNQVAAK